MWTFITSILVTVFISLCFFKKNFWENRYLVLLIGAGVALVAILTTNYVVRGELDMERTAIKEKPLNVFAVTDSMFNNADSVRLVKDWDFYKISSNEYSFDKTDTVTPQYPATFVIYIEENDDDIMIGTFMKGKKKYLDCGVYEDVFFAPSSADTVAYMAKERVNYTVPNKKWLSAFSFPRVKTVRTFYVPPKEYALIPDSLDMKLIKTDVATWSGNSSISQNID